MNASGQYEPYAGIFVTQEGQPVAAMIAYPHYLLVRDVLAQLLGEMPAQPDTAAFDLMRADMAQWDRSSVDDEVTS
jgi:hypothetical protein